jgi:rhamnosyl/mannosyltransferase
MSDVPRQEMGVDRGPAEMHGSDRNRGAGRRRVMHIGKYYPPHMGGIEVHLRQLVRLQVQTCSVRVLVANDGIRTVKEKKDGAELLRLGCLGTISSMPICPTLPWHVRGATADIIHMHTPNPGAAFAYVVSGCRIPLVITHHSDTTGRKILRRVSDPFVRAAMHRASRIIVTTRRYADTSGELELYRDKIEIVPNWIDSPDFEEVEEEAVRDIHLRYGPHFVIAIGRLVPFKGFEILIRAMQNVRGNLVLVGEGPLRAQLEEIARENNLLGRIFFAGTIDNSQIKNYLAAADVLAMPSIHRAESFGIVQLEAMAAGIPVVNTSIESGVSDVSLDGITGITVPPSDPSSLATALNSLLSAPELRQRMGQAGKARVRDEFSVERGHQRTMRIYDEVLKGS